jgi:hypothetical protein
MSGCLPRRWGKLHLLYVDTQFRSCETAQFTPAEWKRVLVDRDRCRNYKENRTAVAASPGAYYLRPVRVSYCFALFKLSHVYRLPSAGLTLQIIFNWWVAGHICAVTALTYADRSRPNQMLNRCVRCVRTEVGYRTRSHFVSQDDNYVKSEVLITVVMRSSAFWYIAPCSPLKVNRRFGWEFRLHLQRKRISQATNKLSMLPASWWLFLIFGPENGGDIFFRYISWLLTEYIA